MLHDLVFILGDPITIDMQSMEDKQSMLMRARLELDLTSPLKMGLVLGMSPRETRIFVSYEALLLFVSIATRRWSMDMFVL